MQIKERIIWAAAIGGVLAAAYFMPASVLGMDLCLFRRITTLECPLCGMTRSMHLASHGDMAGALSHNPMGVVLVLGLIALVPLVLRGGPGPATVRTAGIFLAGGFLACWLLRLILT